MNKIIRYFKKIFKIRKEKDNFNCYEIWRPNIPNGGCGKQCRECRIKENS